MTVREYLSNLQDNLGILLDWFLDGARLLGNFQWLDFTMPQVLLTGFFFWVLYLAAKGTGNSAKWAYSDNNIDDAGYLNAKNLVELNFKFFLTFLFNLFCGFVFIVMAFVLLFDVGDINWSAAWLWIFITWVLIGIETYNRRASHIKTREEYESSTGKVIGEEQEQEPEPEETTETEAEALIEEKLHEFKVNDSENCRIFQSKLIIDGASYSDMGDYEWFFTLAREDFPALYTALTGKTEIPDDVAVGLKKYLQENGTTVTQLKEICETNNIECGFTNYM